MRTRHAGSMATEERNLDLFTVTTEATAGPVTYSATALVGGLILRDCAGASRSDVTPTAAQLLALFPDGQAPVGVGFWFTIRNTTAGAFTITLTAGSGVTLSGTMTIAQNNSKMFLCIQTSLGAFTIYSQGTLVF